VVGVLALIIAGLNYWDGHQQRADELRRDQVQAQAQARAVQGASAFVAVGEADAQGRSVALHPLKAVQAIQSQQFRFPADVADRPKEISAERPHIQLDWLAGGLKRALDDAHAKGSGEARVPVVIETVYVEDGDSHTDVSLYQVGFSWKHGFLGGWQIRLSGLALAHRALTGDATTTLETRWTTAKASLTAH
jgi:hypothetical protein